METTCVNVQIDVVFGDLNKSFIVNTLSSSQKSDNLSIVIQKSQNSVMTTGTLSSVETYSNFDFRLLDLMILIKIWFESDHLMPLF
jgi:hypothetical protein